MKKLILLSLILVLCLFFAIDSFAQSNIKLKGGGGWNNTTDGRLYDVGQVKKIKGSVLKIEKQMLAKGGSQSVSLLLKVKNEEILVQIAPDWFFEKHSIQIQIQGQIEVLGSKIIYENKPIIIAAEISNGDQIIKVRDLKTGLPFWSGWRRNQEY